MVSSKYTLDDVYSLKQDLSAEKVVETIPGDDSCGLSGGYIGDNYVSPESKDIYGPDDERRKTAKNRLEEIMNDSNAPPLIKYSASRRIYSDKNVSSKFGYYPLRVFLNEKKNVIKEDPSLAVIIGATSLLLGGMVAFIVYKLFND